MKAVRLLPVIAGLAAVAAGLAPSANAQTPVSPAVTVSPSSGLSDGQLVNVELSGFSANEPVNVAVCAGENAQTLCNRPEGVATTTDDNGTASVQVTARRSFVGYNGAGTPVSVIDCTTVAGGCVVGATNANFSENSRAAISFS